MLIEHSFVTTQEAQATLAAAAEMLIAIGFTMIDSSENYIELRRGVTNPARAKSVSDLPQRVRVEFDRGRVMVAGSLEIYRKPRPLHSDMLRAIAQSLELLVAQRLTPSEARWPCDRAAHNNDDDRIRRRRRTRIIASLIILFIVGIVCLTIAFL